jgi:enoyl-CoA hydratase/carnithine racemase
MFEFLRIVDEPNGATRVVMDRAPANALSDQLIDELTRMAAHLTELDPRVVLLTSAQPMFQAGADLDNVNVAYTINERIRFQATTNPEAIRARDALINGTPGGGCEMALACDFRIMARAWRIGLPEAPGGCWPLVGGRRTATARSPGRSTSACARARRRRAERIGSV